MSTNNKHEYSEKTEHVIHDDVAGEDNKAAYTAQQHSEETGLHENDAALANAPWKYKVVALVTALMLPGTCYI